ncbi:MAG: extracellular solute-binding protein [Chloroflexi bacterium]|nr:extracellular solute-binding protein [Chloroflexota bacterium]
MRRILVIVALLMVWAMIWAGALPAAAQDASEVTLTMWTHDGLYVQFFNARAEEWQERYPDIDFTFEFEVVPGVFDRVLGNLAAGEQIPDLLGIEQGSFPRFMQGGIIESKFLDLTDLLADDYDLIVEGRHTPYTYQGRVYGVDSSLCGVVYYYQPSIFEERGLSVPTTWDEYIETGSALAEEGIAMSYITDHGGMFMMYLLQRGGAIFDEHGEFVLPQEENRQIAIEVLNLMREGLDSGAMRYIPSAEVWGPAVINAYREGRLAGGIMPDWYSDYILKPQAEDMAGQWRITRMPTWDEGTSHKTTVWGGTGFAVAKESENAQYAWELLQYTYVTLENQIKRYEEIAYYPTMPAAFHDERIVGLSDPFYAGQKTGEVFAEIVDDVPIWYQSLFRRTFETQMAAEMALFFEGAVTAEETIDSVIVYMEDEIAFAE